MTEFVSFLVFVVVVVVVVVLTRRQPEWVAGQDD